MYGKNNMETYITIRKIDSQREFAVWLRKLTQSALTVILKRVISALISIILIVLSAVNLQFQMVCSHFLEASSQNCGSSCRWLQSGHHGVPPTEPFSIYKIAQSTRLRILSIRPQEGTKGP